MLKELLEQGFGLEEGYNCAERIIYGANQAYGMGLGKESLKLFAGMGGGMAVGEMCGAVTASIGVLSHFFVRDRAHEPEGKIKALSVEFVKRFVERMDCYRCDCSRLKELYRVPDGNCDRVILGAAEVLDALLVEHGAIQLQRRGKGARMQAGKGNKAIAVLGGGNGAHALAADLALRGHRYGCITGATGQAGV